MRIVQIASKLMPPVPSTLATMPLNNSVVAVERTFGPMTLNTVAPMANTSAANIANLKRPRKRMSLPTVPLKSRGFSVTIMRPAGPPGRYPRFLRCDACMSCRSWASSCSLIDRHPPSSCLAKQTRSLLQALQGKAASRRSRGIGRRCATDPRACLRLQSRLRRAR